MEVQADLVRLNPNGYLPLPWSVRAHLGLASGAGVTIVLTNPPPGRGRVPDILVTPLTPHRLRTTFSVEITVPEKEGAVRDVLALVSDAANIVLSDTITLEGRDEHKVNLVIEPAYGAPEVDEFRQTLEEMFRSLGPHAQPTIAPTYTGAKHLEFEEPRRIENAYLPWNGWREILASDYPKDEKLFDLSRVVVSSNPDQRLLRYIFPRQGVVQLTAPHNNLPGALREITGAISKTGYNILSSRLSRTPRPKATERMSVFVAVCEPVNKKATPEGLKLAVQAIPKTYIAKRCKLDYGANASDTRYLVPRGARVIRPPGDLKQSVLEERVNARLASSAGEQAMLFFLSYRFIKSLTEDENRLTEHETSLEVIRKAVRHAGGAILEAPVNTGAETSREAIYPRLWAADACLVLALDENGEGVLSLSQAHEIGFFAGQRKPVRVLVERNRARKVNALGNIDGYTRIDYDEDSTRIRQSAAHRSLYQRVFHYVRSLAEADGQIAPRKKGAVDGASPP